MIDKLLNLLIYPLGISLLLGFLSLLLWTLNKNRFSAVFLIFALSWLMLWSLNPVADYITNLLEKQSAHQAVENLAEADVILVFGGVMQPVTEKHPYPNIGAASDRVWHAARLYHAGKAPKIILSGGHNDWQIDIATQAEAMREFLMALGVPSESIILEMQSRNTYENAYYCAQIMQMTGMNSAILVTSVLHMPRFLAVLQTQNVDALPAATDFEVYERYPRWIPNAGALSRSTQALHELIGFWVYDWRGWI